MALLNAAADAEAEGAADGEAATEGAAEGDAAADWLGTVTAEDAAGDAVAADPLHAASATTEMTSSARRAGPMIEDAGIMVLLLGSLE